MASRLIKAQIAPIQPVFPCPQLSLPYRFAAPMVITSGKSLSRPTLRIPVLTTGAMLMFAWVGTSCSTIPRKNAPRTELVGTGPAVTFPSDIRQRLAPQQTPDFLTHAELVALSKDPAPKGATAQKLERFWRTPVVSNDAYLSGRRPHVQSTSALGPALRVATWNIEKSLNITQVVAALTSPSAYSAMINEKRAPAGSRLREEMLRQRQRLASADIVFLQEMDIGVNRSGYVDAARTLAQALGMNYAYAAQALEVDPVLLGQEPRPDSPAGKPKYYHTDPARYKGVFGSAILSRYPIVKVETFQLKTQPYDWFKDEQKRADIAEHGRRVGSALVFDNDITRELKVGGRSFFRVDVAVPGAPGGRVSLINNHLEIKTLPKHREAQMVEILGYIKNIPHPVIMAGDHNSAPNDVSPTSVERVIWRQIDTPASFVSTASNVSGLVWGTVIPLYRERGVVNAMKNFQSPLAPNVPILFPNRVVGLFNRVKEFRFDDGSAFDYRGDKERSINGRKGLLANSNDRRLKGQVTSFSVRRPIGPLGRYRLDWFFVKSSLLQDPRDKKGPYQFAPHYGETLAEFNEHLRKPFSDHRPLVVDLPLNEPALDK